MQNYVGTNIVVLDTAQNCSLILDNTADTKTVRIEESEGVSKLVLCDCRNTRGAKYRLRS